MGDGCTMGGLRVQTAGSAGSKEGRQPTCKAVRAGMPLARRLLHPTASPAGLCRLPPPPPTSSVSCSRVAAAPVGLLGEQKKMMSVRGACREEDRGFQEVVSFRVHSPSFCTELVQPNTPGCTCAKYSKGDLVRQLPTQHTGWRSIVIETTQRSPACMHACTHQHAQPQTCACRTPAPQHTARPHACLPPNPPWRGRGRSRSRGGTPCTGCCQSRCRCARLSCP